MTTHRRVFAMAAAAMVTGACGGSTLERDHEGAGPAPADEPAPAPAVPAPPAYGAPPPGYVPPPPGMAWQQGAFLDMDGNNLGNVSVTAGGAATTIPWGSYRLLVSRTKPFYTVASAPGFVSLVDQEWRADAQDVARPSMMLLDEARADAIAARFPDADRSKGTVLVGLFGEDRCFAGGKTTVKMVPPGAAKVVYLDAALEPDASLTAVREAGGAVARPRPAAGFYDVEPNVEFRVEVSSPCTQRPFPIVHEGVELTGRHVAKGGKSIAFYRVFLD